MDADTRQLVGHMFRVLEAPLRQLSQWELEFLDNIKGQFDERGFLTDKQMNVLSRIYREKAE